MRLMVVARWGTREWLRSSLAWWMAGLALLLGPACLVAAPWGIVQPRTGAYIVSIWYLTCCFSTLAGLALLDRAGGFWGELERGAQVLVAAGALCILAGAHAAVAVGALALLRPPDVLPLVPAIACVLHWAVLGAFVHRTQLNLPAKCLLLSALGWWIPALLNGAAGWERVRWVLGPECHLEGLARSSETSPALLVDTMPLVAWWVAAALLPTRSALRR